MRVLFALVLLAGCSAVPPEPVVPLAEGVGAAGVTLDLPVGGKRTAGLSVWAGVGLGRGVDVAASVDAPFTLIGNLGRIGRDGGVFAPPGLMLRKTWDSGLGLGLGAASLASLFDESNRAGFDRMAVGPFVTAGLDGTGAAARVTAHLVYEIEPADGETARPRGWELYGTAAAGGRTSPSGEGGLLGGRAVGALGLRGRRGLALGGFGTYLGEN